MSRFVNFQQPLLCGQQGGCFYPEKVVKQGFSTDDYLALGTAPELRSIRRES
jgi:hypothetical protein